MVWSKGSQLGEKNIFYGKHHTAESKQKYRDSLSKEDLQMRSERITKLNNEKGNPMEGKTGPLNHSWKGEEVGYHGLHKWARTNVPRPELCEICHEKISYEIHNTTKSYRRNLEDWTWVCRRCHMKLDGRDKRGD